jgi:DNA-binding transcriptional MerR regulator
MPLEANELDLSELSSLAGVSTRTVRYYIQQGLLPPPETRGPGAHYGPEHLHRIRLIKRLQREHLPLAEIRRRLEELSADEIRRLAEEVADPPTQGSAVEYIRNLLSEGPASFRTMEASPPVSDGLVAAHAVRDPFPERPERGARKHDRRQPDRSQWDRIALAPDVELHVRRPLSREQNSNVERLLEAARIIFEEENQ